MFSIYKGYDKGKKAFQGDNKALKLLKLQGFFRGARYRTRTDKKVFWLVPFYAGKYHNVGELCNFIAISC